MSKHILIALLYFSAILAPATTSASDINFADLQPYAPRPAETTSDNETQENVPQETYNLS